MTREEAIKYLSEELEKTKEVVALTERDFVVSESVWHTETAAFKLAIAALREQENPTSCNKVSNKEKMLESNRICSGCRWKGVRHQRCSCCCRNLYLKDNYEEEV